MELDHILIRGARQHNLAVDELRVPKKQLVVFTGVSGSGKSSLAFDTIYAEGQRRYVESLSSYARQFLGQMDKPAYEHIRGLTPTIAIEQKSASNNPRSTVGTITEVYDYLRVLYARVGVQHCPSCTRVVASLSTDQIIARLQQLRGPQLLAAPLVEHRKGEYRELLLERGQRGFARARIDGALCRLDADALPALDKRRKHTIELVVDRVDPSRTPRERLADAVETVLREGRGVLLAIPAGPAEAPTALRLSQERACADCGIGLPALSPQSFSFNSPLGMCPTCNGLGRALEIDPALVVPDPSRSIRGGALEPWAATMERGSGWSFGIFQALERQHGLDLDRPWAELPAAQRELVLHGTGEAELRVRWRGARSTGQWRTRFEGVVPTLMRRLRETKSDAMRDYYQRFLSDHACRDCAGSRLRPESRAVRVAGLSLPELVALPVGRATERLQGLALTGADATIAGELLKEIGARLDFLRAVGLDYLTLERPGPTLAGGEAQRIRLASQLGSELSGVTYVLDEPSIGLHQRDNRRLIDTLLRLRDGGNTVVVVEHDRETIESADHVVDFGPGAGRAGGKVVFAGSPRALRRADTLTGRYLGGRAKIALPARRRTGHGMLTLVGAREHNLKQVTCDFPLGTFVAVTGVSGAGKSSLITATLYPALCRQLHGGRAPVGAHDALRGLEQLDKVIHIDQAPIGRTPRSNPATYTKAFDELRAVFSRTADARARGYGPGRFSFNVAGGRCEACDGDGVRRVEMHFLPDVYVPCEVCRGRRYNAATLEVRYHGLNIADVLELSVAEALERFAVYPRLRGILETLRDVGLEYMHLGQGAPTLSGGEAQRVKLSRELAKRSTGKTLYVLDEPTTGLHFEDIRKLLAVLDRLVEGGNTVIVIEHNLDVIKCADHVLDLGPEGGERGGAIVCAGTPEQLAAHPASITGHYLRELLG
ncbi:MAG: excinuclease ABC subunit UvrA [Proteobacteria bacterium]|nr:excinuclease ABC subunit UvrA [Pseudomonadota bacterium]